MATVPPVRDVMDIFKGRTFSESYTSYDDNGDAEDLSAASATCALKSSDLGTTYLTLSTTLNGNGTGIVCGTAGTITLTIHPTDSSAFSFSDTDSGGAQYAVGELFITKSSSNIESYALITFRLNRGL